MHSENIDKVLNELNVDCKTGLKSDEINARVEQYGKNELKKEKKKSLFVRFLAQFKNIMVIILLISAIISLSIAITSQEVYELIEGIVILFIVIMNAIIGVMQEYKAQACLDELEKKTAVKTTVLRDGKASQIFAREVVVGDIVILEAGDIVPADLRLIDSHNLKCDESSLTGESVPSTKRHDTDLPINTAIAERKNMAFSGSLVTNGKGMGVVVQTGQNSEIGKIASMLVTSKKELTPLQKSIAKIGKVITISVLSVCAVIFLLELFVVDNGNFVSALMTAVALAVAAIPESLPAVITLIMAMGVQQLAKRKAIIKHLHAVETLGSCEIICTDKTGTLTQNKMQVVKVNLAGEYHFNKTDDSFVKLTHCMYLCNEAKLVDEQIVAEPTEKALYEYALKHIDIEKCERIDEIPFDSNRKMMTTVNLDCGKMAYTKGAFDRVIKKCGYININGRIVELTEDIKHKLNKVNEDMALNALRVLAFAYKPLNSEGFDDKLEENMIFLGCVGLRDEPRKEAKKAIEKCAKAGLKTIMITGDHKLTAYAIGKELGIVKDISEVLTGEEINLMSEQEFNEKVKLYKIFARVSPEHKVKIVSAYKKLGKIVAMTGDGVNDAPSLKIADIGVGMGVSGTEVVKSVSDMIITDDNFSTIVVAVEEGRKVYHNIQKALQYLMSTNSVEIFGMLFALVFFPNCTFLLPSQMLFINLITDSLPAFALGVEKVEPEIMKEPPRKVKANIFAGDVGVGIIYQAILQMIIVITVYCSAMRVYSVDVATTMVFFTIIWLQLLHSLNCKSSQSILGKPIWNNKTYNICFILTALINLLVCVCPVFYTIFNLEVLNFSQWLWIIIASISIIPLCEIVKLFIKSSEDKKYLPKKIKQVNKI